MDMIRIRGGRPLNGKIMIGGAKNAALPLMTASLLTSETLTLTNVPHLADIISLGNILAQHGVSHNLETFQSSEGRTLNLKAGSITSTTAPYELVRKMRASILVLGPLLARCGVAKVSLPGGCAIGSRPVDLHVKGLVAMGAEIELKDGYIHASAPKGLQGTTFTFPVISVTGTENLLMAATLAKGTTKLVNAAREPEIVDLGNCLIAMGAKIEGLGTDTITIHGVTSLHGATHSIVPDRIETGTYLLAACMTGGTLDVLGTSMDLLPSLDSIIQQTGAKLTSIENGIRIEVNGRPTAVDAMTEPYPGLATDFQAQVMSVMTIAQGAAMITENIFENRFMHVPELARMGANITVHGSSAMIRGVEQLQGAPVMATDLRASVSLVMAGLAAHGETTVSRIYHLDRGYESLEEKLRACGADIERIHVD